jgi:hypothetical protein
VGGVALGEELAEPLLDLRAIETPPNDGEGAVKVGCHRAERSSGDWKAGRRVMREGTRSGLIAQMGERTPRTALVALSGVSRRIER